MENNTPPVWIYRCLSCCWPALCGWGHKTNLRWFTKRQCSNISKLSRISTKAAFTLTQITGFCNWNVLKGNNRLKLSAFMSYELHAFNLWRKTFVPPRHLSLIWEKKAFHRSRYLALQYTPNIHNMACLSIQMCALIYCVANFVVSLLR